MPYILYIPLALCSFTIDVLCKFLLNWIVAAFADKHGNLPRIFRWFQTFDDDLDSGMRARRAELAAGLGGDDWDDFNPNPKNWFQTYWNRALWLLRNTGYGFDYYLFGLKWNPAEWKVRKYVQTPELTLFIATGPGFNIYYHGRFGMYKLGWKVWNMYNTSTGLLSRVWADGKRVPICFSIQPHKVKK